MAQTNEIALPLNRYTRVDFMALRFKLNGVAPSVVRNCYHEDDLISRGLSSESELSGFLLEMRDYLIDRCIQTNPYVAQTLQKLRNSERWSPAVAKYLFDVGEKDGNSPRLEDPVSLWFKRPVATTLRHEKITTLSELLNFMRARGTAWHRCVPRIGAGKARSIERWIRKHESNLGELVLEEPVTPSNQVDLIVGGPLLPLDRIRHVVLPNTDFFSGKNRSPLFCFVSARNDLDLIRAYLYKFREQPKTTRSYQKELNRFLLWCTHVRRITLADVLVDDCEAYKDFLKNIPSTWIGKSVAATSPWWRPFSKQIDPKSQRYAVMAVRAFFKWAVDVRYLGGNPWVNVSLPKVAKGKDQLDLSKALSRELWLNVSRTDGLLDQVCLISPSSDATDDQTPAFEPGRPLFQYRTLAARLAQYRLARAAILLLGYTGIRREEAAFATRENLRPVAELPGELWELDVLGKGEKWRQVYIPRRAYDALAQHWLDRGDDIEQVSDHALLSPIVIPLTEAAKFKHVDLNPDGVFLSHRGFSPDGLYQVVKSALLRLASDTSLGLTAEEASALRQAAPHAFRHTFATHAVTGDRKIDLPVLRDLLGHSTLKTTSIYVNAERKKKIQAMSFLFPNGDGLVK